LDYTKRAGFGNAVIALMNPGGVRESFFYNQSGTEGDGTPPWHQQLARHHGESNSS
jgi:hypothetical protein